MGIKRFNFAAPVDFPNVIGPNESNPDSEKSHFSVVLTLKKKDPQSYRRLFPYVSEWEKVKLSSWRTSWGPTH